MASTEDRLAKLERDLKLAQLQLRKAIAVAAALEGQPSDATLSIPHNDSFPFEDNVDATHPANLRYVISKNVTRVVSARLSIFMAPYRTYNTLSVSATGTDSNDHTHTSAAHSHSHGHSIATGLATMAAFLGFDSLNSPSAWVIGTAIGNTGTGGTTPLTNADATSTTPGSTGGESTTHTHNISASGVLGVTEGTTATGVTISFDGADATAALGGPFNADVIELDVRRFIQVATGVKHTIAMQPSGNGRIEAFLRLGCYVSAGQVL